MKTVTYKSREHYCYACRKTVRSMGLASHCHGKAHVENVAKAKREHRAYWTGRL